MKLKLYISLLSACLILSFICVFQLGNNYDLNNKIDSTIFKIANNDENIRGLNAEIASSFSPEALIHNAVTMKLNYSENENSTIIAKGE